MITFSKLGQFGRLGNQLFQIAATKGIAAKNGNDFIFPVWEYSKYFRTEYVYEKFFKALPDIFFNQITEPKFQYCNLILDRSENIDLLGYYQSEKYFINIRNSIRYIFTFRDNFIDEVKLKLPALSNKQIIALSVRRGDYVNNINYVQIGLDYYERALQHLPLCASIIVFSDDIPWCKSNLASLLKGRDVTYTDGLSEIESMCALSMCDHFIIPNSTFAWWGAWLGEKEHSIIIAPDQWFGEGLKHKHNEKDLIPERWKKIPVTDLNTGIGDYQIDLKDVTFTIPVQYDHSDRKENLDLIVCFLQKHFDTNIMVYETGKIPRLSHMAQFVKYKFVPMDIMHRTKVLNQMAREADTSIIFNYDADVLFHPIQILQAVNMVRSGSGHACYPYDGRFVRLDRSWHPTIAGKVSTSPLFNYKHTQREEDTISYGGAICWNRESFFKGGGENENFIAYGPEDYERFERFTKLGFNIKRAGGCLYHINHYTSETSNTTNPYFKQNNEEYEKIKRFSREELAEYVNNGLSDTVLPPHAIPGLLLCPESSVRFDRIYCVNLPHRTDRKEWATRQFSNAGIKEVSFFPAINGKEFQTHPNSEITPGMVGCFLSHKAILKEAIDRNYESIIVFEDDLKFMPRFPEFIKKAFEQIPEDWQFCYLGAEEHGGFGTHKIQINKYWVIPSSVWGTHAYMIRGRDTIHKIYNELGKMRTQIDMQLSQFLPLSGLKYYCLFPTNTISQNFDLGGNIQKWNDIENNPLRRKELEEKKALSKEQETEIKQLNSDWKEPFKLASHLHYEVTKKIRQHFKKIKTGDPIPEKDLNFINEKTVKMHELLKNEVRPAWNKIDAIKAGEEPEKDKTTKKEFTIPSNPVELVKLQLNIRTYISNVKAGRGKYAYSLQEFEKQLEMVNEKLNNGICN